MGRLHLSPLRNTMYIPDRGFLRKLHELDDKLFVRWDYRLERWRLFRKIKAPSGLYRREVPILTVEGGGGEYRPLDDRLIRQLKAADTWTRGSNTILDEQQADQRKRQERSDKAEYNDTEDMIKDNLGAFQKDADATLGARNIPKEDVVAALDDLERGRHRTGAGRSPIPI